MALMLLGASAPVVALPTVTIKSCSDGDTCTTTTGEKVRLKVHPRCHNLIRDLKFMVYKEGTDQPDKSDPERSHHSDAMGYCALGAMSPLLPTKLKVRSSGTIKVW